MISNNLNDIFFILITFPVLVLAKGKCDCGLGSESVSTKIFGGTVAYNDEYPWMAHLRFFDKKGGTRYGMCGGFLITSKHVMTAAHCIMESQTKVRSIEATEVYLGVNDLSKLTTVHRVDKFYYPSNYKQYDLSNDIAILELSQPVNFTKKIRPICLPRSDDEPYKRLIVAGFGRLGPNKDTSELLMHVNVEYIPNPQCNEMVKDYFMRNNPDIKKDPDRYDIPKVHETHMCCVDKSTGGDACRGDSGGALMYKKDGRYYAVGIVSGAFDECGDPRTPGFYTTVRKFREMVNKATKDAQFCDY
ncbi:clotting factor G beta subunit-like [Panonychus citri]|uniref:clotting factor G beta subunit-like n=1 Tax=Panonychus citri TaxID=50023 RepID=UPI0023080F5E|nr:clotting factor G beta subunit-like [Panonychus citri]